MPRSTYYNLRTIQRSKPSEPRKIRNMRYPFKALTVSKCRSAKSYALAARAQKIGGNPYLNHQKRWPEEGDRAGEVSSENRPKTCIFRRLERRPMSGKGRVMTPGLSRSFWHRSRPHPWPVAGVAREEGDGCRAEEREREHPREREFSDFIQNPFRNIYDYATEGILIVSLSSQLQFEPTTCLRTHLTALYATVLLTFPHYIPIKKSTLNLTKYSRTGSLHWQNVRRQAPCGSRWKHALDGDASDD
ncbi:unnamed protein product [Prunus armeniaca]